VKAASTFQATGRSRNPIDVARQNGARVLHAIGSRSDRERVTCFAAGKSRTRSCAGKAAGGKGWNNAWSEAARLCGCISLARERPRGIGPERLSEPDSHAGFFFNDANCFDTRTGSVLTVFVPVCSWATRAIAFLAMRA